MKTKDQLIEENAQLRAVLREAIEELTNYPESAAPQDIEAAESIAAKAEALGVVPKPEVRACHPAQPTPGFMAGYTALMDRAHQGLDNPNA